MDGFDYARRKGIQRNILEFDSQIFKLVVKQMRIMSNLKKTSLNLAQAYSWEMLLQYFTGLLPGKFLKHLLLWNNFLAQKPYVDEAYIGCSAPAYTFSSKNK